MRKIVYITTFSLTLLVLFPITASAGNLIPKECTPQLVDGVKMIVCPEGIELTEEQQERINEMNDRISQNQIKNQEKLQAILQKKEQQQEMVAEKKASVAAKIQVKRQERIQSYFSILTQRINATIERLNLLIARIEARLAIFEDENPDADTAQIHTDIDEAKALLDDAKAKLLVAQDSLEEVLASSDPKEAFAVVRDSIKDIKSDLVEVHNILVHVIGDIRGLRVGNTELVTPEPTDVE